jgi:hypothetical protein
MLFVVVVVVLAVLAAGCLLASGRRVSGFAAPTAVFDPAVHAAYQALPDPVDENRWQFTNGVYDRATRVPGAQVLSTTRPRVVLLRSFLTPEETRFLISDNRDRLTRSEVVSDSGDTASDVRTSSGAWVRDSETLRRITSRIHRVVGAPESFGEGLYVLNYKLKQKYEAHNDHCADRGTTVDKGCAGMLSQAGGPACGAGAGGPTCGDRLATFILYLKSPDAGGRTVFPEADATRRALAVAGTTPADAAFATGSSLVGGLTTNTAAGYAAPGGGSAYHYLHHALMECNYGVPWPVDLDTLFGSWVDMEWCEKARTADGKISLRRAKRYGRLLRELGSEAAALAALAKEAA